MARSKQDLIKLLRLNENIDEASLTDAELRDRLAAFQELKDQDQAGFDPVAFKNEITSLLVQNGIPLAIADEYGARMGTYYAQTGLLGTSGLLYGKQEERETRPDAGKIAGGVGSALFPFVAGPGGIGMLEDAFGGKDDTPLTIKEISRAGSLIDPLLQHLNDKIQLGEFNTTPRDYESDISRVQGLVDARDAEIRKDAEVQNFLTALPEDLRGSRESFIRGQTERGNEFLRTRAIPKIAAQLNAAGLLDSGDFGSEIASAGADIQGQIESKIAELEQEDALLFADAAYRVNLERLTSSETGLRDRADYERTQARTLQDQRFKSSEANLARDFNEKMLARETQRNLDRSRADLDAKVTEKRDFQRASDISNIAGAAGQVGGQVVLNKMSSKPIG